MSLIINYFINKSELTIEEIKIISTYRCMNTAEKWHGTTIVLLRKIPSEEKCVRTYWCEFGFSNTSQLVATKGLSG